MSDDVNGPLVVVAPWATVRRWDGAPIPEGTDRPHSWPVMSLAAAVSATYDTDAMMVSYVIPGAERMPLLKLAAVKLPDMEVSMSVLTFDVDPEKGERAAGFKERMRGIVEDLAFDEDIGWWETKRGYRVLVWLDRAITDLESYNSVWRGYQDWFLQRNVAVDDRAKDFTRVMRLPNVVRDGKVLQGDWELPTKALPWVVAPPPKEGGGGVGGLRPLAATKLYQHQDRNDGMFRIACSLRRLGLSRTAMVIALKQVDLDICTPPLEHTDPGEVEAIVGKSEAYALGDISIILGDRPGTDMELLLGSESEIGDWVLKQLEEGNLGVRVVWDEDLLRRYDEDSGIWVEVTSGWIARIVMDLDGCWVGSGKGRRRLAVSSHTVKGVWALIQAKREVKEWSRGRPPGVLVDGVRWTLESSGSPSSLYRDTWMVAAGTGDGDGSKWSEFLSFFTCGDGDMEAVLQEWTGAMLFGVATTFQKALMLYGGGNNGKSVFLKVISSLVPKDAKCSIDPKMLEHEYWRARLVGKVLNVVTEIGKGRRGTDSGAEAFKAIVTGDTIGAREPRGKVFDLVAVAAHVFSCNALPSVSDFTRGFWRKWIALPCDAEVAPNTLVVDYEKVLLASEGAAIVAWAVEGARRLIRQNGYSHCSRGQVLVEAWRHDADQVAEFLGDWERMERLFTLKEAYSSYLAWAASEGTGTLRKKNFKLRMEALIGKQRRIKGDDGTPRLYELPERPIIDV